MNGSDKIIDALVQLVEGYREMSEAVEEDLNGSKVDGTSAAEVEAALANEIRSVIESVIENEGYAAEEIAPVIVHITNALEELEPDAFGSEDEDEEEEEEDEDEDEDEDEEEDEDEDEDDED